MIELTKTLNYLNRTELMGEEMILCSVIAAYQNDSSDPELLKAARSYYTRNMYYDREGSPLKIAWVDIAENLIKRGFLESGGGHVRKDPKTGNMVLEITRLATTAKFRDTVFTTDKDGYWEDFCDVYGRTMQIKGKIWFTTAPNTDKGETSMEDVKNKFWKICNNGEAAKCEEVLHRTQQYIEFVGGEPNMKITNFLDNYDGFIDGMLREKSKRGSGAIDVY